MNKTELVACAEAKSDQIDADNLIGGITMDVTIKAVQRGPSNEQPLQLVLAETEKFYRPSKTYRRALIGCFGDEPANWVGKRLRLVRNPDTTFGGVKVGGIEVSHASIAEPVVLMLAAKRGKKSAVKIDVMPKVAAAKVAPKAAATPPAAPATPMPDHVKAKGAAMRGEAPVAAAPSISGDPSEGDLSGIGIPDNKPTEEAIGKVVHAFANIGYTIEQLEAEYGKRIDEWTMEDMDEAREVYKLKAAERKEMLAQMAAEKAAAATTEEVI